MFPSWLADMLDTESRSQVFCLNPEAKCSASGYDGLKDRFSFLQSQQFCTLISACLKFASWHTLKISCALFEKRKPDGCGIQTQIVHYSRRTVTIMMLA